MAWVKLDDQFPFNSKTRALTVEARYLYVTSLCWCAMQMNDGTFPVSDIPAIAVLADVPQNAAEQLMPALWHPEGFDCEACADAGQTVPVMPGHVAIHCFLERNESRAKAEERRRKDRQRKAPAGARQRSEPDSGTDSRRNPPGIPAPRNPGASSRPVPTGGSKSSRPASSRRADPPRPDDDGISTAAGVTQVPDEVWALYADVKFQRKRPGTVDNAVAYKLTTADNARLEQGDTAARWWADYDVTPDHLARCLVDGKAPSNDYRRRNTA